MNEPEPMPSPEAAPLAGAPAEGAPASPPAGTPPLATHAEFLAFPDLATLEATYRERGATGTSEDVTTRAQLDWGRVALEAVRELRTPPERFEPHVVERDGVRYAVFGVFHGLLGGADADYKQFVDAAVRAQDCVLYENALQYFYPSRAGAMIPDFVVFGVLGSLGLGLFVGLSFPIHLWDLFAEPLGRLLRKKREDEPEGLAAFDYSPRYHAIDVETRRGVDALPVLPARLQRDYELPLWDSGGLVASLKSYDLMVPRSMFMAGFAQGYARSRGRSEVALLVGDLHTAEIALFLAEQPDHTLFRAGERWGRRSDLERRLLGVLAKVAHLTLAGLAGVVILGPALVGLIVLLRWWQGRL